VGSDPKTDVFTALLKDASPNVINIGAAVPRCLPTGGTEKFSSVCHSSDLALNENGEDVHDRIEYKKEKNTHPMKWWNT